ncbi:glycosyltransferase family 2 protein [Candidatus Falkowbacteria bacterium]|nr:glycosyltransferase family 2 protein [Candidatus Falkowbacteria bacterium]
MLLSIIILNYKSKGLVKYCLKNIATLNLDFDYEIIVIDNDSRDNCLALVEQEFGASPKVKTIQSNKNLGMGAGNNLGIRKAQGKYILVLNPDIIILKGTLEKMISFLESDDKAGIVAPKLKNPNNTIQTSAFRFPNFWRPLYRRTPLGKTKWGQKKLNHFLIIDWDKKSSRTVDWALGACLLFRKKDLDEIGLFDERFFLFFEDTDLCRRYKNSGREVWYLHDAPMIHYPHRLSAKKLFSSPVRAHLISQVKYFLKWRNKEN